jgi:hypothetical protein
MKRLVSIVTLTVLIADNARGQGFVLWNEAVNGPLSETYVMPTHLGTLFAGTNSLLGTVQATPNEIGWVLTNDYFTFQVPSGFHVEAVTLSVSQQILAWLGTTDFGTEIGHRFTSTTESLIPFFGGSPLDSSGYGMYMSDDLLQSIPTAVSYRLDFLVSPVPEPGTWALLALGGGALLGHAARRRRK